MSIYNQNLPKAYLDTAVQATDTELVAAKSGYTIEVASLYVMADTAMTVTFESGTSTARFKVFPAANGGVAIPAGGQSIFDTLSGEGLYVSTSTAGNCFAVVSYFYEKA